MTAAESLEEAKDYIAKRQGTIDTWQSKEQNCPMFGVSFWVWKAKEWLGKAMRVGTDLVEIVAFLKEKELFAIANGVMPKMETPPPAPAEVLQSLCHVCMMWQPSTNSFCDCCGSKLPY